jgi:hypothetical protein
MRLLSDYMRHVPEDSSLMKTEYFQETVSKLQFPTDEVSSIYVH